MSFHRSEKQLITLLKSFSKTILWTEEGAEGRAELGVIAADIAGDDCS